VGSVCVAVVSLLVVACIPPLSAVAASGYAVADRVHHRCGIQVFHYDTVASRLTNLDVL
jgi:hypothetical protein